MNATAILIRRALISVSNKTNILSFASALVEKGVEIISTGGTAKFLGDNGIPVIEVSSYTGFPEIMGGRLKTLHPKIHGGLLGRRGQDDLEMKENKILPIDLLVVNLYPFEDVVSKQNCEMLEAIENIDIGGPAMLRAAAKNYVNIAIATDTSDYERILDEILYNNGMVSVSTSFDLAVKAFEYTCRYDGAIANYLGSIGVRGERVQFPRTYSTQFRKAQEMRYGENPHQSAAFYITQESDGSCIATARKLQGKELSYNNIADTDTALECVKSFSAPSCVIVKHSNPCGVSTSSNILEAYNRAYKADPNSAFGGVIAFNRPLDGVTAKAILDRQFVEVIIAPEVTPEALAATSGKTQVRVLAFDNWDSINHNDAYGWDYKRVGGGLLLQNRDLWQIEQSNLKVVTRRKPSNQEIADLLFVWKVVKFVKSNAIVYGRDGMVLGIGAGQMSRVFSVLDLLRCN